MPRSLIPNSGCVLEFDELLELVGAYASSPLVQARIAALTPAADSAWITEQQGLAEEVREFRRAGGRFDFSGLWDATRLIEKARIAGAALENTEIRDVLLLVDLAAHWRQTALHPPP